MKILVFSDSHSSLWFMRRCVSIIKPDGIIHLGDHAEDGSAIASENPSVPFYHVPGNCDSYYRSSSEALTKICEIGGVKLLLTHGHRFQVKSGIGKLLDHGRSAGVQAVLFGHTHTSLIQKEPDGLLALNPGAAGSWGGSAGILEIRDKQIAACRIIEQADLDALV